jgi:hypothetical protein
MVGPQVDGSICDCGVEGTRRRHGEIFNYYRDARLNANGFFRNADPKRGRGELPFFNQNPGVTIRRTSRAVGLLRGV